MKLTDKNYSKSELLVRDEIERVRTCHRYTYETKKDIYDVDIVLGVRVYKVNGYRTLKRPIHKAIETYYKGEM